MIRMNRATAADTKISTVSVTRKKVHRGWKVYLNGKKYPGKPVELYEGVSEREAVEKAFKEAGLDPKELEGITWGDDDAPGNK